MWLLNSCSWELKEFISHKQAPPYAILSHTWGDEEIKNCCRQAVADGFEWVWIDTCCIDKTSSAELSEAINSMFQWYYKSASACYAYLCDVFDNIELNLAGSRWITRGWTLQELIAPRSWNTLRLSAYLATVTRINEPFLIGRSRINEASIAQRMSWAAMRSTSREEDEAYCLLGLFNVNMPLIYGEGPKAFRRLQEVLGKIVKQLSDQVNSKELWGSKPLDRKDSSGEVENELFGLLAESPNDFKHARQVVVCAPNAKDFFGLVATTVSVSAGRTACVSLPQTGGPWIVKRRKHPPISE
ncbi:heterokaryon incompatibility protein-domain-containing protein [Xylaria castorea]|nr:heterokaryon incompatibility protein-domain-containing protein [Xylaria castorea]